MGLRIHDIMEYPSMKSARVQAGNNGMNNVISGIMVMEAPDVESWGYKGLVLLSSLFSIQHYSAEELMEFMERLHRLGISAMIIKIDRFVAEIPPAILEGGDHYGIPIIRIEKEIAYSGIMASVMQTLFNQQVQVLEFFRTSHMRFTQLALQNASGKDIARTLSELIKMPVTICNAAGRCEYTTNLELQEYKLHRTEEFTNMPSVPSPYQRQVVEYAALGTGVFYTQVVIGVQTLSAPPNWLIVHETERFVNELDLMAIENAAAFLQMDMLSQQAVAEARQKYLDEIFDDLVNGRFTSREIMLEYAVALELRETDRYRLVSWQFCEEDRMEDATHSRLGERIAERVRGAMGQVCFSRVTRNRIQFLFRAEESDDVFLEKLRRILTYLQEEWTGDELLLRVAVGEPVTLELLKNSAEDNQSILYHCNLFLEGNCFLRYRDLGIYALLTKIKDPNKLAELIPQKLRLLKARAPDLLDTLRSYLDCNKNLKETAAQLYVHHKTVRYRIDKIVDLIGIDFTNSEEMLQIGIGLRIYSLLDGRLPQKGL